MESNSALDDSKPIVVPWDILNAVSAYVTVCGIGMSAVCSAGCWLFPED